MVILILFLITLWAMAFLIWLLWKWFQPGNDVRRPHGGRASKP